jgi:dimethylargininase
VLRSEADRLKRVIVCSPREEYFNVTDPAAHNITTVADRKTTRDQHDRLKGLLRSFGAEVIDVPELAAHPNSVFTRDTALCTPEGYIELLPGIETRRAEGGWMASHLDKLGESKVGEIAHPGTVDGGDVLLLGRVAFVGLTARTNTEGCRQLSHYLEKMGYEVRRILLPETVLHLDKVMMPVCPGKLLVCTDMVPQTELQGFDILGIRFSGVSTANIICLGEGELILGHTNREAMRVLDRKAFKIHLLDVSEFIKGAGGPNCLILPVERESSS